MNHESNHITVIVPVFNEEDCLHPFKREMDLFLDQVPIETTICFVDDGSTDRSAHIISEICASNQSYSWISLRKNSGLSTALKAGIDHCRSALVGYIDADLQTKPMDFLRMLAYLPSFDMVNGIRQHRNDGFIKKISSVVANGARKRLLADGIHDTCCPLKIIKTEYARKLPAFKGMHRFMPALVQQAGGRVKQIPVNHFPRYAGTAKYHLGNRLIGPLCDALALAWLEKRRIEYQLTTGGVKDPSRQSSVSDFRLKTKMQIKKKFSKLETGAQ